MQLSSGIISIAKNKYLIAVAVFLMIMLFFDRNNFFEQIRRKQELSELQASKEHYLKEIDETKTELSDLSNNPAAIEKYAREHFQMKRDNEDVFIAVPLSDTLKK